MNTASCNHIHVIIDYIENNLSNNFNTDFLSKLGFVSHTQLYRDFYNTTGHSVKEYVRKRRLSNALALIKASELSLSHIAYQCGYSSQQALCRSVKTALQETPLQYKNNEEYYFFPPYSGSMKNQITVSSETIPKTICYKYYHPCLKGIEDKAIHQLKSFVSDFHGRIFGRNGLQEGNKFCYELYLTEADTIKDELQNENFHFSHETEAFTSTFAATIVRNNEKLINAAWDYLYTDWLSFSMFEHASAPYFEEYLFHNDKLSRLKLYLPLHKRNDYSKIRVEQHEPMNFLISKATGLQAEQVASQAVIKYLAKYFPYIIKTSKEFYFKKDNNSYTCGIKLNSDIQINTTRKVSKFNLDNKFYAVLYCNLLSDYIRCSDLLLTWLQDNNMSADKDNIFAVYDVNDSYENPKMKLYCPIKLM